MQKRALPIRCNLLFLILLCAALPIAEGNRHPKNIGH